VLNVGDRKSVTQHETMESDLTLGIAGACGSLSSANKGAREQLRGMFLHESDMLAHAIAQNVRGLRAEACMPVTSLKLMAGS
jgi:hypothetical protein